MPCAISPTPEELKMDPLLCVEDLRLSFLGQDQPVEVLRGIDFSLQAGECVGIVGESGCGKSALAKALAALHPKEKVALRGKISLSGESITDASEKKLRTLRREKIGYIFQDPLSFLNPMLKIGTQLKEAFPSSSHSSQLLQLLALVGLSNPEEKLLAYPHMLSGGQRQRILIAMALASNPELVIADEPTTALDVTVQAQILALIADLKKRFKMSLLLITHDLKILAPLCDRVLVMYAGKIVEEGSVDDIFYRPKHPYTQKLLAAIPRMDRPSNIPLIPLPGSPPNFSCLEKGCSFFPRCEKRMKICSDKEPPLLAVDENTSCACWLYDKGTSHE